MENVIPNSILVEKEGKDHSNGDDVGDVRHEEDGLEEFLKRLDGMDGQGDDKGQDNGDWNRDESDEHRVPECAVGPGFEREEFGEIDPRSLVFLR